MTLLPLANPLGSSETAKLLLRSHPKHPNPNPNFSAAGSYKPAFPRPTKKNSRVWCSNQRETSNDPFSEENLGGEKIVMFKRWDVPWDWKVTALVMMPYVLSIVFTSVLESGLGGVQQPYTENVLNQAHNSDELAIKMLVDQVLKSVAKLSVLYMFVNQHQPFPDGIFSLSWDRPLNVQKGWVLWAGGGLLIASSAVFLLKTFISSSYAGQTPNETETLARLLPMIGSSNVSTVCLLGVAGFLAPICEETLYRGFLLTSLTKWFPMLPSIVLSSAVFTLGHQSPGKALEIFVFGIVLGLVYARTRNLLAPITIHALWNSGVIILLTYLQSQGHDIQKYVL